MDSAFCAKVRATPEKRFLLSRFNVCKTSERSEYFSKVAGLFLANFPKINTVTGIFQGFYLQYFT